MVPLNHGLHRPEDDGAVPPCCSLLVGVPTNSVNSGSLAETWFLLNAMGIMMGLGRRWHDHGLDARRRRSASAYGARPLEEADEWGLPSEVVLEPGEDPVPPRCVVNLDSVESVSVGLLVERLGRLSVTSNRRASPPGATQRSRSTPSLMGVRRIRIEQQFELPAGSEPNVGVLVMPGCGCQPDRDPRTGV